MRRRRFLRVAAAAMAVPGRARAETVWRGRALGAEVSVRLIGATAADGLIAEIRALLARIEAEFSLHDAGSALSRLNAAGRLAASPVFLSLVRAADRAHRLTGGRFDPTVQPLFRTLAAGGPTDAARGAIGWSRVRVAGSEVTLQPGQALTFNGIAQGHATDRARALIAGAGFGHALIDIGEYAALGGPFRIGIEDPEYGPLGRRTLDGTAVATSSPGALRLGRETHILDPFGGVPRWSTVSVEADSATLADSLSTALCFATRAEIAALAEREPGIRSVTLVSREGDLATL